MKDGGPAFPVYPRNEGWKSTQVANALGMTLRDYFAAKAMQAFITSQPEIEDNKLIANAAYFMADTMIKARDE